MIRQLIRLVRSAGPINAFRLVMVRGRPEIRLSHIGFGDLVLRGDGSDREVFRHVFVDKCYDIPKFAKLIPTFQPRTIVDAGANVGFSTVYFRKKYPAATIVAVEPDRDNFRLLETNAGALKGVHLLRGALWYRTTT